MGASLLPITIYQGVIYLLFGKERDIDENPGWSDFGGGTDAGESFMQTAVREGMEETTGFLGNASTIRRLVSAHGVFPIDYHSEGHGTYRCHIFPLAYDPSLIQYYNANQAFLQQRLPKSVIRDTKIFEKTQLKWFPLHTLASKRNQFRSFYRNIIDMIVDKQDDIQAFAKRAFSKQAFSKRAFGKRAFGTKTKRTKTKRTKTKRLRKSI